MSEKVNFENSSNEPKNSDELISTIPKARFIKKGHFIKKELPTRGRSVITSCKNSTRYSPTRARSIEQEGQITSGHSPKSSNKSQTIQITNKSQSIKPRLKNQNNRLIRQFGPQNLYPTTILKDKLNSSRVSTASSMSSRFYERKNSVNDKQPIKPQKLFSEENTQTILNRIKFLRIKKIFNTIDYNKKGIITYDDIINYKTDPLIIKILRPIFEEIALGQLEVNLLDFEEKVDKLLMKIPKNERMMILDSNCENQFDM
ncbi:hypothetical protein SteCoe_22444 [Stentor coeruleus]|uniref:EF-hand domain-containing protein n=1 Tax=Stentor coeruleus TaxID=5963 RepID=A0A1R2BM96_9CILI|nr:hypothetical protein SteCoe_22444 [Stentor coeruleus]